MVNKNVSLLQDMYQLDLKEQKSLRNVLHTANKIRQKSLMGTKQDR